MDFSSNYLLPRNQAKLLQQMVSQDHDDIDYDNDNDFDDEEGQLVDKEDDHVGLMLPYGGA